ncbi:MULTISPECIES: DUF4177 domain-containing protein [Halorussus]|uniref:DUF4177 domain-containing protein n=1 Tax=Halorussus TaxID=1070314 RepID=UPI00209C7B7F|nr:DUF4177 domain-containing protein [Halorussus vallis]USZ73915.1 DUF4177 domain-containing protein [Halorussus vallis]
MTRREWEYETLRPPREGTKKESADPQEALNELGREGWELAATVDYDGGGTKYFVLKRPARDAESEATESESTDE